MTCFLKIPYFPSVTGAGEEGTGRRGIKAWETWLEEQALMEMGGILCVLPPPLNDGQCLGTFGAVTMGGCDWPPVGGGRGCCWGAAVCRRVPHGRVVQTGRSVALLSGGRPGRSHVREGEAAPPRGDRGAPGAKSESAFGPRARLRGEVGAILSGLVADTAGDQGSLDGMCHFPCVCFCVYSKREGRSCRRVKSFFSSSWFLQRTKGKLCLALVSVSHG